MQSIFSINKPYESNLIADFSINLGTFNTNGQFFIMQHAQSFKNLISITSITDDIIGTIDNNNYFTKEYRWSFNTLNWTNWVNLDSILFGTNSMTNVYFQIKYTWNTNSNQSIILNNINIKGNRKINEIYAPITLGNGEPVILTNADTYKVFNITDYKTYVTNNQSLDNVDIQFRYTQTQGRSWSNWFKLTKENLQSINFDPIRFCNFQFGFQNNSGLSISIYDLELIGKFQNVSAAYLTTALFGIKTQCSPELTNNDPLAPCDSNCLNDTTCVQGCGPCSQANTPWSTIMNSNNDECSNENKPIFNVNSKTVSSTRASLMEYLNDQLANRNGYNMTYYLADPDTKGSDPIMHEHQLHNILMSKDIMVIVPDGQFPNNEITLSGFDLDLIQTFEVHITKKQFKEAFGVEFRPGNKDFLYFCDFNQMWEVDQMIPARGAYNAETYWRVLLKKYNDRKSRKFVNQSDKDVVDALTHHTTLDSLFGIQQDNEFQRVAKNENINIPNTAQLNNNKSELSFIKYIDSFVEYETNIIWNSSLTLSESQYKLPLTSKDKKLITYNHNDRNVKKSDNRAISMWFKTDKFSATWDYTLLSNYDYTLNKGYKLDLFNGMLNFTFNNNTYNLLLNNLLDINTWYCIFVNLHQTNEEIELAIYRRQSETGKELNDSKLLQVSKIIHKLTPDSFSHIDDIFIGGVDLNTSNITGIKENWYLTNIRLYKQQLIKNKRNIVLNERIPNDTHLTLLVDNAEEKYKLDYYGNI